MTATPPFVAEPPAAVEADPSGCAVLSLDVSVIQEKCRVFEMAVLLRPEVTPASLNAIRPPADASGHQWLDYLVQLAQMRGTVAMIQGALPRFTEQDAEDLRDALSEAPCYVPMSDGETRGCYPKSDFAMRRIEYIDAALQYIVPRRVMLEAAECTPAMLEALDAANEAQSQLEREFLWIATHPAPDVPWDDDGQWEHDTPAWTREAGGYDLQLVRAAYIEVNYRRLNALAERTHAMKGQGDTMSPEAFNGVMASELGIAPRELSRKWSRCALYAMAFTKWEAHMRAEARAKDAA